MKDEQMEKITIAYNRRNMLKACVVGVVLFAVFLLFPASGKTYQPTLWLAALAALAIFIRSALYLHWNRPALILDEKGILDQTTTMQGAGRLEWGDINELRLYTYMSVSHLGIVPVDVDKAFSRHNFLKKAFLRYNRGLGYAPYNIAQPTIEMPLEELVKLIRDKGWFKGTITGLKG